MKPKFMPEIVLVNTQIPENLGATARSMLNFGLDKLRLVAPDFDLTNEKIIPLAAGANSVIKNIRKFEFLDECVKDFNILVAVTNRIRSIKKKQINFEDLNKTIYNNKNKVGIVFGPEKSGLDNNQISICDFVLKIESNPTFSSLNLSHAVSIVSYEIMQGSKNNLKKKSKKIEEKLANKSELINFYSILEKNLDETNFFLVKEREKIIKQKIRNIFNKLHLTSKDVKTLLGIIKSLRKNNQK